MAIPDNILSAKSLASALLLQPVSVAAAPRAFERSVASAVQRATHNVHAVGVGKKWVQGAETPVSAVRIYVTQKLPLSLLSPDERLPAQIEGVPTDVIESPPAFLMAVPACSVDRRRRQRPIVGGISTGHFRVTAGTLACICHSTREGDDGEAAYVLSNNHVYADVNHASPGDVLLQPGVLDGGGAGDEIADLARFAPITLGGTAANAVDAAIGRLRDGVPFSPGVCSIGAISGTDRAREDMRVRKHGRTSGYTEGVVTDESYDAIVGMDHANPAIVARFTSQMRIERTNPYPAFGLGGDSGSLVVRQDTADAVGLYFAGPQDGTYGIANHIDDVLRALEIRLG